MKKITILDKSRGQTSTEFLLILAVGLMVILAVVLLSQSSANDINKAKSDAEAKNALSDLSSAAKEVYAQGIGAKKLVYINMPSGIEPQYTAVANKSIRIRISGNDYAQTEPFEVHGTLPATSGGHMVWVLSEGNKVRIGYAMIELSRQTLLITMKPNDSRTDTFSIKDIWNNDINTSISYSWAYPSDASFTLVPGNAALTPNASVSVTTTTTTADKAIGIYLSELDINANDAFGNSEIVKMPVILQVLENPNEKPPLFIVPPIFNATINRSMSETQTFQVCTNTQTSVTSVDFFASSGEPGSWMSNLGSLGPIGKDTCVPKEITATVPPAALLGNISGNILVNGNGPANAKDSLALQITVGGARDNQCPIVRNITTSKRRVHINEPTTLLAVGDDNTTGGSLIRNCEIKMDSEVGINQMFPNDGVYDNQTENISFTYFDGFGFGTHKASLRCFDIDATEATFCNWTNYSFVIGKHILFVVANGNETDWSNWITTQYSNSGYPWDYDVATTAQVLAGTVQLGYYDVVIFIDWSNDAAFVGLVNDYKAKGGYLGLFGESAHKAVRDLNVTWHPDNPHPEHSINILNNSHYVTQGIPLGLLNITDSGTVKTYELWNSDPYINLGASGWFYPSTSRTILADVNRTIFWGVMDPWKMNANGVLISQRVIDYMISQSTVG